MLHGRATTGIMKTDVVPASASADFRLEQPTLVFSRMKSSVQISRGIESLFGTRDENIRLIEGELNVRTRLLNDCLEIEGEDEAVARASDILSDYSALVREGHVFNNGDLNSFLRVVTADSQTSLRGLVESGKQRSFGKKIVAPKTMMQRRYVDAIERHDLVFGVGPAGTGKTYLAVAMAVSALMSKRVSRIILTRPAVEAGERLGFLPGTLQEKIDPFLRPLYDALYDMLEAEKIEKLLERNTIEVAPIAFMRGRTLNDSFIIMDEAQNCSPEQMKMILTRQGFNSKMVVTGDPTQIDLPNGTRSGLIEAVDVLRGGRRHQLCPVRRPRRGAPQPGAENRESLRALQRGDRRQPPVVAEAQRRRSRAGARHCNPSRTARRLSGAPHVSRRHPFIVPGFTVAAHPQRRLARILRRHGETCRARPRNRVPDHRRRRAAPSESPVSRRRLRHRRSFVSLRQPAGRSPFRSTARQRRPPSTATRIDDEIRILMLHGVLHLTGLDHETDAGEMARAEMRWRKRLGLPVRPDREGARMIYALAFADLMVAIIVMLVTCVQLLYLESLRIRTRERASLEFFKTTLESKLGLETERGSLTFSLIKNVGLAVIGCLTLAAAYENAPGWQALAVGVPAAPDLRGDRNLRGAADRVSQEHRPGPAADRSASAAARVRGRVRWSGRWNFCNPCSSWASPRRRRTTPARTSTSKR